MISYKDMLAAANAAVDNNGGRSEHQARRVAEKVLHALRRFDAGPSVEVAGVGKVGRYFREPAGIAELLLALRGHQPVAGIVVAAVFALPVVAQTLVGKEHLVDRALR